MSSRAYLHQQSSLSPPFETPKPPRPTSIDAIEKAFNTWAFKREQPSDIPLLRRTLERAVNDACPIDFVLYWGKGPRASAGAPETTCLNYLQAMADRIGAAYQPGARLHLIFTDTHARLNGHPATDMANYFTSVTEMANATTFETHRLSHIVERLKDGATDRRAPDPETMERLVRCAEKWFAGEGSSSDGARRYYDLNMIEKRAIEAAFPHAVFVTFNGSDYRSLFPDAMPIFYMYSLKRGFAVKPWFMPDTSADTTAGTPAN